MNLIFVNIFQGTHTSELHLSNLEAGDYKFRLTVADESGQEDTADVLVNVQPVGTLVRLSIVCKQKWKIYNFFKVQCFLCWSRWSGSFHHFIAIFAACFVTASSTHVKRGCKRWVWHLLHCGDASHLLLKLRFINKHSF